MFMYVALHWQRTSIVPFYQIRGTKTRTRYLVKKLFHRRLTGCMDMLLQMQCYNFFHGNANDTFVWLRVVDSLSSVDQEHRGHRNVVLSSDAPCLVYST